jgi:hypothetical protein
VKRGSPRPVSSAETTPSQQPVDWISPDLTILSAVRIHFINLSSPDFEEARKDELVENDALLMIK